MSLREKDGGVNKMAETVKILKTIKMLEIVGVIKIFGVRQLGHEGSKVLGK